MRAAFHLAHDVRDLDGARRFHGDLLGCHEGRGAPTRVDLDVFGHRLPPHPGESFRTERTARVGDHPMPMPHLGVALSLERWRQVAKRPQAAGLASVPGVSVRFGGGPGTRWTLPVPDPAGNPIGVKGLRLPAGALQA